ncbi:MAG: hypothetical protein EXR72_22055 [Myxococcales bacterium]|nr:hypothetical protein [Myxococcales bacterium]
MEPGDPRRLHRLHDGDLAADERARVEAGLSDEDRARLAAIEQVGAALRNTLEAEAAGFDIAAAVMARLPASPATAGVTPISAARSWRSRARGVLGSRSVWLSTAVAAAAAVLLFALPWGGGVAEAATDECEIESLEVTGASATVLRLPATRGEGTSTVVWLDEEEGP